MSFNAYPTAPNNRGEKVVDLGVHSSFPSQEKLDEQKKRALAEGRALEVRPENGFLASSLRCYLETRQGNKWVTMQQAQAETGLRPQVQEHEAALGELALVAEIEQAPDARALQAVA